MGVTKYGKRQGVHFSKPYLIMVICRGARDSPQGLGMYLKDISWTVGEDYSKQCITLFTAIRTKRCIYEALWPAHVPQPSTPPPHYARPLSNY